MFSSSDSGHGKLVSVRITVLGCSGSVVGPDSPASGYLLTAPDTPPLVIDFGGGVLGALQRHADPNAVHVLLSHLHADHCLDLPGLFVWRRYHPSPAAGARPDVRPERTRGRASARRRRRRAARSTTSPTSSTSGTGSTGEAVQIGALTSMPRLVCHPTESYGMRITDPSGATFVYSGDTGACDALVDLARGADVFLCEASWTHDPGAPAEAAPVGHRGGPGRRPRRRRRAAADAHSAVDVARGRHQRGEGRVRRTRARGGVRRVVRRHPSI